MLNFGTPQTLASSFRNYYGENSVNIRQKLFLSDQQVNCYNVFCAVSFYVDLDL
jgi:hypothetical protein